MEEKKSGDLMNVINPKKKAASKPNKDAEAKAKVQELLKNTSVSGLVGKPNEAKVEFDVAEIKQEKTSKWMEGQIDLLNKQVEDYENEILYYKEELRKAQEGFQSNGVGVVDGGDLSPNLVALFRHFESVYENGYTDAKIAHAESGQGILDMMLQFFPQLQNVRRYRYRGQQR